MAFLPQKPKRLVGVDFGSATIKLVELERDDNKLRLVTYGIAERDHDQMKINTPSGLKKVAVLLQEVIVAARVSTSDAVTAVPALNTFNTILELPRMPTKELDDAVRWEAKKLVPMPLENMSLDWQIAPPAPGDDEPKTTKIILTAAPRDIIKSYVEVFKRVNLNVRGIETEITALRRSLVPYESGTLLLIDIGATNTNLVLFSGGIPLVNRNVDIGGKTITKQIANRMGLQAERAEQFKNDIGLPVSGREPHPAAKSIAFLIDNMIIREIQRLIKTMRSDKHGPLKKIYIIGGCAHLKHLSTYLETTLHISTNVGNPWELIIYPSQLRNELQQIGPQLSVAAGLAMKKIK